jgi:hypothetical protein
MLISVVMMREWSIISMVVAELPPARNGGKDRNPTLQRNQSMSANLSHIAFTSARYLHQCAGRLTIVHGEPHQIGSCDSRCPTAADGKDRRRLVTSPLRWVLVRGSQEDRGK